MTQYLNDPERLDLVGRLLPILRGGGETRLPRAEFDDLAARVLRFQRARCEPLRRLCEARGLGADDIAPGGFVPALPTDLFKRQRVACFPPCGGEIVFRTSGTTEGAPGLHHLATTELYDAGAAPWLERHLLPEGERLPLRWISLTSPPEEAPQSSLVHMIALAERREAARARLQGRARREIEYFWRGGALRAEDLLAELRCCAESGEPVLVFTTSFALVHLLEEMDRRGGGIELPPGSRVMETGGYKGRSRELDRGELYVWAADRLGLPRRAIVNEYGMTELSSQFHDRTLAEPALDEDAARVKLPPPWVRAEVVDPRTLEPVGEGEVGMLRVIDLANLDSCAFLLVADAARRRGDGFELLGRLPGASMRGCSLDYEARGEGGKFFVSISRGEAEVVELPGAETTTRIGEFIADRGPSPQPMPYISEPSVYADLIASLAETAALGLLANEDELVDSIREANAFSRAEAVRAIRGALSPLRRDALMTAWKAQYGTELITGGWWPDLAVIFAAGAIPQPSLQSVVTAAMVARRVLFRPSSEDSFLASRLVEEMAKILEPTSLGERRPPRRKYAESVGEPLHELMGSLREWMFPSIRDTILCATWPRSDADLTRRVVERADSLTIFGGAEAVAELASFARPDCQRFIYGPRVSFAVIEMKLLENESRLSQVATALADDLMAFDQRGCLSPSAIYLVGDGGTPPARFCEAMGAAVAERAARQGWTPEIPSSTAAAIHALRAEFDASGPPRAAFVARQRLPGWTLLLDASGAPLRPSPGYQTAFVIPVADWDALVASAVAARDSGVGIQAMAFLDPAGSCPEGALRELERHGLSRVCALGETQVPPLDWRHDGNPIFPWRKEE